MADPLGAGESRSPKRWSHGVLAVLVVISGACAVGGTGQDATDQDARLPGELVEPPECAVAAAPVCAEMSSAAAVLITGLFPRHKSLGPRTISVLPDGRLRYAERICDRMRNRDADLKDFRDGMRTAGWTELSASQPFRQQWEKRQGVHRPLVLTAGFLYETPVEGQRFEIVTIEVTVETLEPIPSPKRP
ncbi:MAG: hypothetical protein ACT4PX_12185 [Actinomycetota bacterium]